MTNVLVLLGSLLFFAVPRPATAGPRSECYLRLDGVGPEGRVECIDGDACDADGAVDGACSFRFTVCGFQPDSSLPDCLPQPLTEFRVSRRWREVVLTPPIPVSSPTCAETTNLVVSLGKRARRRAKVRVTALAGGRPHRDRDRLVLACHRGEPQCVPNPAGGPRQVVYTISDHGTDLDTGVTGVSHNFPIPAGARVTLCLSGCDATGNPVCRAEGPTGPGTANGTTLGPPLPLFAAGVPVCVINTFAETSVRGTVDVQTGTYESIVDGVESPIVLDSEVFSTSSNKVCPECVAGHCDSGTNETAPCTVEGRVRVRNLSQGVDKVYALSSKCPPGGNQGSSTGTLRIVLPVTTGTGAISGSKPCPGQLTDDLCGTFASSCSVPCGPPDQVAGGQGLSDPKGGINQWCCGDPNSTPCFPTSASSGDPNHAVTRTGTAVTPVPPWPDPAYPKVGEEARLVATFCIASTGSSTIDHVAGLPGPGAVIFNGTQRWLGNP